MNIDLTKPAQISDIWCGLCGREVKDIVAHHKESHKARERVVSRPPLDQDRQPADYRPLHTPSQRLVVAQAGLSMEQVAELRAIGRRAGVL